MARATTAAAPPRLGPLSGPLGRRLLAWLLLLSLVPLFVSNTLGYRRSEQIIADLTSRYLDALASVEAKHIRSQVERYILDLEAIAAGNEFLTAGALRLRGGTAGALGDVAEEAALTRHLQRKLDELLAFHILYLQAPEGRILAATRTVPPAALRADLLPAASSTFAVAQVPGNGEPLFVLSTAVLDAEGRVAAHLRGLIGGDGLGTFLEIPEHLAGSIESFIVDAAGRPLFVSHHHGTPDHSAPLSAPVLAGPPGRAARYANREGVDVIGIMTPVEDLPWRYLAEAPVDDALGPLRSLRRASLVMEAIMAALLIALAWLVVRDIVGPVGRLVGATRQVGRGDLAVRVPGDRADEIGELGRAFNEMASELSSTQARVEELHRRDLERAHQLATVGELASGVAHEIKNPVVGIANGMDLVHRRVGDDPTLTPILDEMDRQLRRIGSTIRDLLAFARPAEPSLAPTDPNRLAERAARLVQPAAERAGVELALRLTPGLAEVDADGELVRQALVNLVMNAVQACGDGGRVTVSSRRVEDGVELVVEDTGRGIAPGDRDDIFKPFFTTRHSGTGLGLSITKEVVERHGGRIEVRSRLGEGSTFTVTLPRRATGDAGAETTAAGLAAAGSAPDGGVP